MAIDIKQSDYFEFLGIVKHVSGNTSEVEQVTQGIDSIMSILGAVNEELDKWFPDNRMINGIETCSGLMSVIKSLQSLIVQYGEIPLLKKLCQGVGLTCARLAKKNKGEIAEMYSNLHTQIFQQYGEC